MIKTIIVFLVACFVGLVIQGTMIQSLVPAAIAPDTILILCVFLALRYPTVWGMISAYLLGIAADFASAQFVGPVACGCVVAFSLVIFSSKKMYLEHPLTLALVVFGATIIKSLVFLLMISIYIDQAVVWSWYAAKIILIEALLTAILGPFVIRLIDFLLTDNYRSRRSSAKGAR